jgi:hypothetical protein
VFALMHGQSASPPTMRGMPGKREKARGARGDQAPATHRVHLTLG